MRRTLLVAAIVALMASGCSSRVALQPGAAGTTPGGTISPRPSNGAVSPTTTTVPKPGTGTAKKSPGGATPTPTGTQGVTQPLDATLDKPCVHRGVATDLQGLTIHTNPDVGVGYVTRYSDGSSAASDPALAGGGQGGGFTDSSGTFRATWVVPAAAPLGEATVLIGSENKAAFPTFIVVAAGQACP